jgi:hypothetical protein
MAHTKVSNIGVMRPTVTGGIWRLAQTIALPTDATTARPVAAIRVGGVSEDGVSYMSERTIEKRKDWNGDKVASLQTDYDDTFETTFIEFFNPNLLALAHGDANVSVIPSTATTGTQITVKDNSNILPHSAYIIDTLSANGDKHRRCLPDAQVSKREPIVEKPGDWSVYKLTFDLFPDAQGNTQYRYDSLNDKWVATNWLVTITGAPTSATLTFAVDGGTPTAGVAYTSSTAATVIDTALETLTEVGTGNATVTGSAGGPYTVGLARGGVLAATATFVGGTAPAITVAPA